MQNMEKTRRTILLRAKREHVEAAVIQAEANRFHQLSQNLDGYRGLLNTEKQTQTLNLSTNKNTISYTNKLTKVILKT